MLRRLPFAAVVIAVLTTLAMSSAPVAAFADGQLDPTVTVTPNPATETTSGSISLVILGTGFPASMPLTVSSPGLRNACRGLQMLGRVFADLNGNFNMTAAGVGCVPGSFLIEVSEAAPPFTTYVAQVTVQTAGSVETAPVVTSVTPSSGTTAGGTTVTITGSGFTGATQVSFGGTPASSFTVNSDSQITAVTPAHAAGSAQVSVTTPGGTSTDNVDFAFVAAAPVVTSVTPSSGTTAGGTTVTITGSGFTGATQVSFGGTPVAPGFFTVFSDSVIAAYTPPHVAGPAQVTVTTPVGTSTDLVNFTYVTGP